MAKTQGLLARLHILTPRQVLAAEEGDLADGGGLVLRIGTGRASWVLRYTAPCGRRREMGLGVAYRDSLPQAGQTLAAARELAHDARELLREGRDPLAVREERRLAALGLASEQKAAKAAAHWTLARCARDYHEREIEPVAKPVHAAQWISSLENHVPAAVWHAPIGSITAPQLLEALQGVSAHERARNVSNLAETVRRIRQRLDTVFVDAQFHGRCVGNPAATIAKKLGKARPKKAGQFAALDYRQAPALLARLRAMPGTAARCLEFAVLTAARTSEALLAEWSEIDLVACTHVVPAHRMKAGEEHTVVLSPRAVEVLKAQQGQDPRYVFPSTAKGREGKPQSNMAMLAVLDRLGVRSHTTVHGLARSTFSTWANERAVARPDVIEACLAHRETDLVRKAYNRAQFNDERGALLLAWASYLAQPSAAVLPFGGRAAA
jgi:integrase